MYGALDVGFTLWRFSLFRGSFRDGLPGSFRDRFRFGTGEHVFAMFFLDLFTEHFLRNRQIQRKNRFSYIYLLKILRNPKE